MFMFMQFVARSFEDYVKCMRLLNENSQRTKFDISKRIQKVVFSIQRNRIILMYISVNSSFFLHQGRNFYFNGLEYLRFLWKETIE